MEEYKVGGYVRDSIMGIEPKDIDYVVVDSSVELMEFMDYKLVGSEFPVFLHPQTGDEYALARVERKTGDGYGGFSVETKGVTLIEDLQRRDLTINSIAMDFEGTIIDPFDGQVDIENKILRHTSDAFLEDPVRVLRVARFLARFGPEWTVAPETMSLCRQIIDSSDWEYLTKERVWAETEKALSEPYSHLFFKFLHKAGEHIWFKELWACDNIPQPKEHHAEKDVLTHTLMVLERCSYYGLSPMVKWAALLHDTGKPICHNERGNLYGHDQAGLSAVKDFCDRLSVPKSYRELAMLVCEQHTRMHAIMDMRAKKIVDLLQRVGAYSNKSLLQDFIDCCHCDAMGRLPRVESYPQRNFLRGAYLASIENEEETIDNLGARLISGKLFGELLRQERIKKVRRFKENEFN
jgi:tRNA nucleotidyltransferase (CCA-adding enzyme)